MTPIPRDTHSYNTHRGASELDKQPSSRIVRGQLGSSQASATAGKDATHCSKDTMLEYLTIIGSMNVRGPSLSLSNLYDRA